MYTRTCTHSLPYGCSAVRVCVNKSHMVAAKTSCESKCSSAYSEDLRWRVVYQSLGLRLSYSDIAKNLCVDVATVKRTVKLIVLKPDRSRTKRCGGE